MTEKYDHNKIESKWQEIWEKTGLYRAALDKTKQKYFLLVEFPYPSGDGLHVGHVRSYTAMDIIARKRRAEGKSVLYPIGWDAFGLPTENYAIKTGTPPAEVTKKNTDTFRRQLQSLGLSFDWSREINTTDPAYFKWTQWIFLKLYEKGLAYKAAMSINWCLSCKIGLANEEVVDGACERCGGPTEKRMKEQWMLAITKYADRLDKDLDDVDYLSKIKIQQRNWIGRSEGAELEFPIKDSDEKVKVFTTRPDTLFGATYLVLAPEHLLVRMLLDRVQNKEEVARYIATSKAKNEIERTAEGKEKTGAVLEGIAVINPANEKEIPVYIADYVLVHYGTGAIMAVPAHDDRDLAFALKFNLPIQPVIANVASQAELVPGLTEAKLKSIRDSGFAHVGDGLLFNSGDFNGMDNENAKRAITEFVAGTSKVTYKLRDWVFSRQRYWGEPIPMIHCEKDGWVPVPEKDLPVTLPDIGAYKPSDTGESPLAAVSEWVNTVCPKCGGEAKRETDTMPNWAGSSWYYLRYADPYNDSALASRERLEYWTPVDWYNGGMEHTTLHLLYSRFWHKFLYDIGVVPTHEPYAKRTSHGLILAEGGEKMSKSKGNVVNPDTVVANVGADTLRLYEMFMGPFDQPIAWSTDNMVGVRRFLERVWNLREKVIDEPDVLLEPLMHRTIKKVSADIEELKFNTAISAMMIFVNECEKTESVPRAYYELLLRLLAPFAPHAAEELWSLQGHRNSIHSEPWPMYDEEKTKQLVMIVAVQVNGKVRDEIEVPADTAPGEIEKLAQDRPKVQQWLREKSVKRLVYVPGRLVNIVAE